MNKTLTNLIRLQDLTLEGCGANHKNGSRTELDRLRAKLPEAVLRRFDHLVQYERVPLALLSESGACGSCHLTLTRGYALRIRGAPDGVFTCPHCGCFLCAPGADGAVTQTSKSAVARVSKPASRARHRHSADFQVGDTAGWETCATALGAAARPQPQSSKPTAVAP